MSNYLPVIPALKQQAKVLRRSLETAGTSITHSQSLELVAKQHGFRDWNTLHAAAGNQSPVTRLRPGSRVKGLYLGQSFEAEVLGLQNLQEGQAMRVTLHFDEPVDVIRFESFSSFRQRVSCTLLPEGQTHEKTSDGVPHLVLTGV